AKVHDSVPPGQTWCLFSYWRSSMSPEDSRNQRAMLVEGLSRRGAACEPILTATLMAHYRTDDQNRMRGEPWMFASGAVRVELAAWFCSRFRRPVAFWGDAT